MYTYYYGDKYSEGRRLVASEDHIVVGTKRGVPLPDAVKTLEGKTLLSLFSTEFHFPSEGVYILKERSSHLSSLTLRDHARSVLTAEDNIRFAGRLLQEADSGSPIIYKEKVFVKFQNEVSEQECRTLMEQHGLTVEEKLTFSPNAYVARAVEGTGSGIFQIAEALLKEAKVEYCHPELLREKSLKAILPNQWHLGSLGVNGHTIDAHVNIEAAWKTTRGEGIVIAVLDDGVDIDHEEFRDSGKIVAPRDVAEGIDDPRPKDYYYITLDDGTTVKHHTTDDHGTACAGVACAAGNYQAAGVAPAAKLMPIRTIPVLGDVREAKAFEWAANHGADVISCSWGPTDGDWTHAGHAAITFPLPASTKLAIDYAVTHGRNGKGCVVLFAAGNGNESVEADGYASYDKVIAVAAYNDTGRRSVYSDFGPSVWCTFPSGDFEYNPFTHPAPLTAGIWTTDRTGYSGYERGSNYTSGFGGTSSSCPGVAGIVALILSANPDLTWMEVKAVLRNSCVKIDSAGGHYDATGHSHFYGYGRPDAAQAVLLAKARAVGKTEPFRLPEELRLHSSNGSNGHDTELATLRQQVVQLGHERDVLKEALRILLADQQYEKVT